jgi:hypothetical protein
MTEVTEMTETTETTAASSANGTRVARARASFAALVLALVAYVPEAGASQGFRCGVRVVSLGDRISEVRNRCGEPDAAERRTELREVSRKRRAGVGGYGEETGERVTVEITIDEWTYDFGRARFTRHLKFENGLLAEVSEGGRGSKD